MKIRWLVVLSSLVMLTGCGVHINTPYKNTDDVRTIFLNYVPPNEPNAPHDMEWLVENTANDLGYYGTSHFPGTLNISEHQDSSVNHYQTEESVSLTGAVKTKRVLTGTTHVWGDVVYSVDWNINGVDFDYLVYQEDIGKHNYVVSPENSFANVTLTFQE